MSESSATADRKNDADKQPNLFARIALFVRQVVAELRKVVTPTRSELVNFSIVVLVFVMVCMAFVLVLDFGFGELSTWMFGSTE